MIIARHKPSNPKTHIKAQDTTQHTNYAKRREESRRYSRLPLSLPFLFILSLQFLGFSFPLLFHFIYFFISLHFSCICICILPLSFFPRISFSSIHVLSSPIIFELRVIYYDYFVNLIFFF